MAKKSGNENLIDLEGAYSKSEAFVEKNSKLLSSIGTGLILVVIVYFGWKKFVTEPAAAEALEQGWKAEYFFANDSLDHALLGHNGQLGFQFLAEEYSGTPSGNLYQYYTGLIYLHKGQPFDAIDAFDKVSFSDDILATMLIGNMGDAYVEIDDLNKGLEYYEEAARNREGNDFLEPLWGMKAALIHQKLGNWAAARDWYKHLKDTYPKHNKMNEFRKYLAFAEARLNG